MPLKPRVLIFAIAMVAAAVFSLGVQAGWTKPLAIKVRPVHLDSDRPSIERVGKLRYRGGLRLTARDRRFGGLSGLTFIEHDKLLAVSDHGWWVSFNIVEKAIGQPASTEEVLAAVAGWKQAGWTAQTGSLKTLCQYAPARLAQLIPEESINRVCILVR